jgi:hypothetical protein
MIIQTELRYCRTCQRMETHDVEYHVTRAQRKIEDAQVCTACGKRAPAQHISRAQNQNGGMGDQRYATRRAGR